MTGDITQILAAIAEGDPAAHNRLYERVYQELKLLAGQKLSQEPVQRTLQPTALVHEAYLRLTEGAPGQSWQNRKHFFGAAAETMRRILVEQARRRGRVKRGGDQKRVDLDPDELETVPPNEDLLALDEALSQFSREEPEKAELVQLRYFAGLTLEEAADLLSISRATASRYWTYARAWLFDFISGSNPPKK
jgi:RNA polymerase sigma factor (TIGR02999 family)